VKPINHDENTAIVGVPGKAGRILKPGDIVGDNYELLVLVGEGGIGIVYRCWHKIMQREFALKLLKPTQVNEQTWQRFQVEARAIAKLDHPNVVKIFNMGIDRGDCPYYVMELLNGGSLGSYIGSKVLADLDTILDIFEQLTAGLGYAHSKGIIHRDIKPANIILENSKSGGLLVKIVDFGMAKLLSRDTLMQQGLTSAGEVFGTPLYMSPEQSLGSEIDQRSDIYSLGCTFFKTLTGEFPFRGANSIETILLHQTKPPPSINDIGEQEFPQEIDDIVQKMLAKRPDDRYQTMVEVRRALQQVGRDENALQAPTEFEDDSDSEYTDDDITNSSVLKSPLLIAVLCLLFIALGTGGYFYNQSNNERNVQGDATQTSTTSTTSSAGRKDGLDLVTGTKPDAYADTVITPSIAKAAQDFANYKKRTPIEGYKHGKHGIRFFFPVTSVGKLQNNRGIRTEAREEVFIGAVPPICLEVRENDPAVWAHPEILEKLDTGYINELRISRTNTVDDDPRETPVLAMLAIVRKWKNFIGVHFAGFNPTVGVLDFVETFPHLTRFTMNNSNESGKDLAKRSLLRRLSFLEVSGIKDVDDVIAAVSGSKILQSLLIDDTSPSTAALESLKTCPNLTLLSYGGPIISDEQLEAISNISSLRTFVMRHAHVGVETFVKHKNFKHLTKLETDDWSKAQLALFHKSFPNCRIEIQQKRQRVFNEDDYANSGNPLP